MAQSRPRLSKAVDTLNYWHATGLAVTFSVVFFKLSWDRFAGLLDHDPRLFWGAFILGVLTVFLFFTYAIATHHEIALLATHLDESKAPEVKFRVYYTIVLLAIFFGVLILVTTHILVYGALVLIYNIVDFWGGWQVRRALTPLIRTGESKANTDSDRTILAALRTYYLEKPTLERVATIMWINWLAVLMATVAHYEQLVWVRDAAYALICLNILIGELIILRWRKRRDEAIARAETLDT